jgi:hypothetical protein
VIDDSKKKLNARLIFVSGISTWGKKVGQKFDKIKIGDSSERLQYVVTAPISNNNNNNSGGGGSRTESPMLLGASARMKTGSKGRTAHSSASSLVDDDNWYAIRGRCYDRHFQRRLPISAKKWSFF